MGIRNRANERTAAHIPRAIGCRGTNATPGIAIQLDELEYLLPGLYPGVVLAIEGGSSLFRVLKNDSMAMAALS